MEPIADTEMMWTCVCGKRDFNHYLYCAACGKERPAPPVEERPAPPVAELTEDTVVFARWETLFLKSKRLSPDDVQ